MALPSPFPTSPHWNCCILFALFFEALALASQTPATEADVPSATPEGTPATSAVAPSPELAAAPELMAAPEAAPSPGGGDGGRLLGGGGASGGGGGAGVGKTEANMSDGNGGGSQSPCRGVPGGIHAVVSSGDQTAAASAPVADVPETVAP